MQALCAQMPWDCWIRTGGERLRRESIDGDIARRRVLEGAASKVDCCCGGLDCDCREQGAAAPFHVVGQAEGHSLVSAIHCEAHAGGALREVHLAADDISLHVTSAHERGHLYVLPVVQRLCTELQKQACSVISLRRRNNLTRSWGLLCLRTIKQDVVYLAEGAAIIFKAAAMRFLASAAIAKAAPIFSNFV